MTSNRRTSIWLTPRRMRFMVAGILVCGVLGYFIAGPDGRALGGGVGAVLGLAIGGLTGGRDVRDGPPRESEAPAP